MEKLRKKFTRKLLAINDSIISSIVSDESYEIREDGTVWRRVITKSGVKWRQTGKARSLKNGLTYRHLKYKGANLLVHRIVYYKFFGTLATDLVVNHKDHNTLNNRPENLELVSQSHNCAHAER